MNIVAFLAKIKNNSHWRSVLSFLLNKYILILILFGVWMVFFDTNSWLVHHELNEEIEQLESNKNYYQKEIDIDQKNIQKLKDTTELERFAREEYFMKREDEDIYIIEYQDSVAP